MKRQPSLHIKRDDLIGVLDDIFHIPLDEYIKNIGGDNAKLADAILKGGRKHALNSRCLLVDNAKLAKSTNKFTLATRGDAALFSQCLSVTRKKLHHIGVNLIKPGGKDWEMVKEVTLLANTFCEDFEFEAKEGFLKYLDIALRKMKKFSLSKFNSVHSSVCNEYKAILNINRDDSPELTKKAHELYCTKIDEKTGMNTDYSKNPEKYECFIQVVKNAKRFGVTLQIYITSQFEALEWRNGIPDPLQLYGEKSEEWLSKYLFANGIKTNSEKKDRTDWSKIKGLK